MDYVLESPNRCTTREKKAAIEMQRHLLHEHPLKLVWIRKRYYDDDVDVDDDDPAGCDDALSGKIYACKTCMWFYLHQSGSSLPQRIEHSFHPCPLLLKPVPRRSQGGSDHPEMEMMLSYRCEQCNFEMDAASGQMLQSSCSGEEGNLLHFSHCHPLKHSSKEDSTRSDCDMCWKLLSGKSYGCQSCGYYLHEYCAGLPRVIRHFFHPCLLVLEFMYNFAVCDACRDYKKGCYRRLAYRCKECNFTMHPECTQFSPIGSDEEGILHFTHHHPLKLTYEEADQTPDCYICEKPVAGRKYECRSCGFYIHESCRDIPREIRHFFHPCTLFLKVFKKRVDCDACLGQFSGILSFGYHCKECDFKMHVACTRFYPIGPDDDEVDRIRDLSHYHPLKLSQETGGEDSLGCNLCSRRIAGQAYGACKPCRFYIHKACMGLPEKIQHRCHPCPLFLRIVKKFHCNVCLRMSKLPLAYECSKCEFYMDAECAHFSSAIIKDDQAEHILHFCHQHPLQLFKDPIKRTTMEIILDRKLECFVCRSLPSGLTYGCKECDVFLHKPCLDVLPQILSIRRGTSVLIRSASAKKCTKCFQSFSGFFFFYRPHDDYHCVPCALEQALSVRVSPTSVWIERPYHPCSLILKSFETFNCNACFRHCSTHAYYCGQCDFYMGQMCEKLAIVYPCFGNYIRHFCHLHPLEPLKHVDFSKAVCRICGILIRHTSYPDRSYSCRQNYFGHQCDFDAHKSCLDNLHQKIDHHYFGRTLVLLTTPAFKCILCGKERDSGLAYRSIERAFKLCMECFFQPKGKLNDDGTFTSIHHWHQLSLIKNLEKDAYHCLLCGGYSPGVLYYHCKLCKGYFHKDCAELPFEMRHPVHPQHPLTLVSTSQLPKSRRSCSLCLREFPLGDTPLSGIYHCKECCFQLDRKCAGTCIPSIYYQGHPHLLTVVEYMYGEEECGVCSAPCKISNCAFRCVECKFSLHLYCGPLPCDIKHPCHVHPLVLDDFYVEENYTDKFPCHVCENERDPMLPVYRCPEGCPMVSEIGCAMSEVMPKLLGHHGGEVALRTTFPNMESLVILRDEISECRAILKGREDVSTTRTARHINLAIGNSSDYVFIRRMTGAWEREMLKSHDKESERAGEEDDDDDEKKKKKYSFSKEAFIRFSSNLGYTLVTVKRDGIPEFISQHNGPAAGKEHFLPQTLVPMYQEIIAKYRAIGTPRNLSYPESKSYFVSILCAVLHNMRTTKVVDVTSKRVREWLSLLKLVELAGFDVSFAVDKIKRVWDAHFLTKAKEIADETSDRLRRRREELSGLEKDLVMRLEATRKEMEEIEKQEGHHHKYLGNGMRSLRKEYADSLLIKWKPCSTDII